MSVCHDSHYYYRLIEEVKDVSDITLSNDDVYMSPR